jgi:hypothetical protein
LLDWFRTLIDINPMLSQLPWDTWHVGQLPNKDIFVVPKKIGEREFLFFREVGTDGRRLGGITSTQINLLDVCLLRRDENAGALSQNF